MGNLYFSPLKKLVLQGLVGEQKLERLEMNTYAMTRGEWDRTMDKFRGRLRMKYFNAEKSISPFYLEFQENRDLDKYKHEMSEFVLQILKVQIKGHFIRNNEQEYEEIIKSCKKTLEDVVDKNPIGYYMDFATIIIEKIG